MARLILFLLTAWVLTCLPVESKAGDDFTRFQIDNKNQYFIYLGIRTPIVQNPGDPDVFVQATTLGLGYRCSQV